MNVNGKQNLIVNLNVNMDARKYEYQSECEYGCQKIRFMNVNMNMNGITSNLPKQLNNFEKQKKLNGKCNKYKNFECEYEYAQ